MGLLAFASAAALLLPAEFGQLISDETETWRKVVAFAGVLVDQACLLSPMIECRELPPVRQPLAQPRWGVAPHDPASGTAAPLALRDGASPCKRCRHRRLFPGLRPDASLDAIAIGNIASRGL
ncbi:MAG: hypothetical protein WA702_26565 [Bradyrhizobium sp.]|uniref:hypothetical protein n=1 Tax=Bradyrhizobium sp. TaxID=376 RepID=UPI003C7B9165